MSRLRRPVLGPRLLAAASYDPGTAASVSTASLLAMTAIDTTNLRLTFTAPANGAVLVRQRGVITAGAGVPQILIGVLDGATVRGRVAAGAPKNASNVVVFNPFETASLVTGLTAGQSYTWDAAYGVETVVASSVIKYGGPNNNTTNDAWGAYNYEVWSTESLLAGTHYDPGTAASSSVVSALAITAFDTTNLRLTFTAPAWGNVLVRMRAPIHGTSATTAGVIHFAVLEGSTVRARSHPMQYFNSAAAPQATDMVVHTAKTVVTGLTPGTSYTWDAAYGVETVAAGGVITWGGPDDTSADNAFGGFSYDVWDAGSAPLAQVM